MAQNAYQRKASDRVAQWLAARQVNSSWLAGNAKIDPGTVADFLAGTRWPKLSTQGKIESALGWPAGSIRQISMGADPDDVLPTDSVGGDQQTPGYVAAPGTRVEGGVTNEDLLREILRGRAEYDQLRAEVRDDRQDLRSEIRALSERVARLEQQRP
ncbi:hypothetical protein [Nocardioides sp.]|uniref:hypothetical protein n=1 Tax=Nocardioides sp. TaxID=35761 RepID=UPI003517D2A3